MGDPVHALPHFLGRFAGRGKRLLGNSGDSLARLAADDVAERVLELLGAAVRREAPFRLLLLGRIAARGSGAGPRVSPACRSGIAP